MPHPYFVTHPAVGLASYLEALTPPPDETTYCHRRWRPVNTDDSLLPSHARRFVRRLREETGDDRWALRRTARGTWLIGLREIRAVKSRLSGLFSRTPIVPLSEGDRRGSVAATKDSPSSSPSARGRIGMGDSTVLTRLLPGFRLWREAKALDPAFILWAHIHHYKRARQFAETLDAQTAERDRDDDRARVDALREMSEDAWRGRDAHSYVGAPLVGARRGRATTRVAPTEIAHA